jgi:hypothetical protein
LWQDYLTALMADLREPALLQLWIARVLGTCGKSPVAPAAVEQAPPPGPPAGAASVAGASREAIPLGER